MKDKIFVDTNVLLYLLSNDLEKKSIAKDILKSSNHISIQVLNEFSNVSLRKFQLSIDKSLRRQLYLVLMKIQLFMLWI